MTTRFEDFADTLTDDARDTLYGTVPVLIAWIGGADGALDAAELDAAIDELIEGARILGPSFRRSASAEDAFARIPDMVRHPDRLEFHGHLVRLRDIVREMPADLAAEFRAFVLHLALHLARASGGFLGLGEPINEDERMVITRIVSALEIPVDDPRVRASLGLEAMDATEDEAAD
jgi:hypothetical protein